MIGITQYDVEHLAACDVKPQRAARIANPLTYEERVAAIRRMLSESGLREDSFDFTPFPIDEPERLPDYLDPNVVCLTTICEQWNRFKNRVLSRAGYRVDILWDRTDSAVVSGTEIRMKMIDDDPSWKLQVTPEVADYLDEIGLPQRLKAISTTAMLD
jgi:nicotinamide mononucleotide adenylyltransferase